MEDLSQPTPEPTVLDWFRSLLRLKPISIPDGRASNPDVATLAGNPAVAASPHSRSIPLTAAPTERVRIRVRPGQLRLPLALLLAFAAQLGLEQHENVRLNVALYLVAGGLIAWSMWSKDFDREVPAPQEERSWATWLRPTYLLAGIGLAGLAYLAAGDNTFRLSTLVFWVAAVVTTSLAFWQGELPGASLSSRVRQFLRAPRLNLSISPWAALIVAVFVLATGIRFARLEEIPVEMWSDHAEKILDIIDVLNGKTSIFFPRNAGREPIQFYTTAAAVKWFGAEISFLTLKRITTTAGVLTLPFIYLFGREIGGRKLGLAAMALAGVAYWPNVMSRVGMRAPFYPLFLAPAMYYLVRGLQARRQNDFVLCGLALGIGVYSYTSARLAPLVIALGLLLFLLHRDSRGHRLAALRWLGVATVIAIVVAIPFLRAAYQLPDDVFYRVVTRVTDAERELPGPAAEIFLKNLANALRMFSWDFGEIWVFAVPFRPALDWVMGGLFHLGVVLLFVGYLKRRNWLDLFLPLSILLLILPSVLALAFPGENPHPSRAGGAIVPVFTIAAITLVAIPQWGMRAIPGKTGRTLGYGIVGALFLLTVLSNYSLVVSRYGQAVRLGLWNSSQMGTVARGFADSVGSYEEIYVVAYPHWVDSRLIAINAGRPGTDFGIWPEQVVELEPTNEARLFFVHPLDEASLDQLRELFPRGVLSTHRSEVEGRDFLVYWVPPAGTDTDDG